MIIRSNNIIFDVGGVLLDWQPRSILQQFTDDKNLQEQVYRLMFKHTDWQRWDRGVISIQELMEFASRRVGLELREIERLMDLVRESLHLKLDSVTLLDELHEKGYTMFCLSNMPREHYHVLSEQHDFWDRFAGVVISALVGWVKPEKEIYHHLLQRYDLAAENCVLVDDYIENIEAAEQIGMKGILFTSAEDCRQKILESRMA